jgi:hypothetical protein
MKLEELKAQIAEDLNIDPSLLTDDAGPGTIPEWDSMGALGIISVLDRNMKEGLSMEYTEPFKSFTAIAAFARQEGILTD